jgi:WD40 repeat protein
MVKVFPSYSGSLPSRLNAFNWRHYFLLGYWVCFCPSALHRYLYDADPDLYPRLGWDKIVKSFRVGAYRSLYAMTAIALAGAIAAFAILVPLALTYNLQGHTSGITAVAVTPDARSCISAGSDRRIKSFIPNSDRTLKVWNLDNGRERFTLARHNRSVATVAVTPDSRKAISGGYDTIVWVWDLQTGKALYSIGGHERWISDLAVAADNTLAVSASGDGTLRVWEVESGEERFVLRGHQDAINAVAIAPDSRTAVSASSDRTLKVWDLENGTELLTLTGHQASVNAVAITADNRRIISASSDRTLKVWDLSSGQLLQTLSGHGDAVTLLALTADGRAISGSKDNTLKIWNLDQGRELHTFSGHRGWISDLAIADNRLISASSDHTLKVWDLDSGRELNTLSGHGSFVQAVAAIPQQAAAISVSYERFPKRWNLASGRPQWLVGATIQRSTLVAAIVALGILELLGAIAFALGSFAIGLAWFGLYGSVAVALLFSFAASGIYTGVAVFIDRLVTHPSFRAFSEALLLSQSLLIVFGLLFGLLLNIGFNLANRKTLAVFGGVILTIAIAIAASVVVASVIQRPANSLRAPMTIAWRTVIQVGFWFNLLVFAGSLRLPFYPFHFLLALYSRYNRQWHPVQWDETVVLPLPRATQFVGQQLSLRRFDRAARIAANPFQRAAVQRALMRDLHSTDAPLFWLDRLLADPDLDRYCYAPVMPRDWRDLPSSRHLLLAEIAGETLTPQFSPSPDWRDRFSTWLTAWQRCRQTTPLTRFAGVLYQLLRDKTADLQSLAPEQLYSLLEAYPGGVEIHHSFDLMAEFLSYRDLSQIASAVDIVGLEPFTTLLNDPDIALRPMTLAALQTLSEVAACVAKAEAAPVAELRAIALSEALAQLADARSPIFSSVTAPDSTLLLRIIDQWQQILMPHLAATAQRASA